MGPDNVTHTTKYDGIVVQSSMLGISIPKGWGTNKLGCNLIGYSDFSSKQTSSGKGGNANAQYTYKATLVLGICQGPIAAVRTIYKDQAIFTATPSGSKEVNGTTITISSKSPEQAAGITQIFTGAINQAPWPYLQSDDGGAQYLGYSGLAYAAAYDYPLDTSATSPNHNFEVQFALRAAVNGVVQDDANPADIITDLLPGVPRWPAGAIGDLSTYSTYCLAQGLLLSPIADQGRQASDLLTEIMTATNSDCFWSDGQLQVVPYGDTAITNNGVAYTPNLTPIYSLTWDDIIPNSKGEDPIQWDLTRTLEAYNYVQVNFLDRTLQYAANTATAVDQANVNAFGRRQQSPQSLDSVCLTATASTIAQLMVQRSANVRRTAEFTVSELFGLLDPMDLITVPLRDGGTRLVRIVEANEQDDGGIQLQVEEMLVGTAHAAEYTRQDALGVAANFNVAPGDTNAPAIINPPLSLTNGANEVWIAASGGAAWGGCVVWSSFDGDTYQQVGVITQPGRYGVTTTDFPTGADPDTTDTLGVDLTQSGGTLTAGTQADADGQATLCAVGTEIIAYSTATLTAASRYTLGTYIRRGLEGTTIADQPAGSLFMRLDNSVLAVPYNSGQVGKTLYVKLQAFNLYGGAYEDLDLCTAYEFIAEQNGDTVGDVAWTTISGIPSLLTAYAESGGVAVNTASVGTLSATAVEAIATSVEAVQAQLATADTLIGNAQSQIDEINSSLPGDIAAAQASLNTDVANLQSDVSALQTQVGDVSTNLSNQITSLQTATETEEGTLSAQVAVLQGDNTTNATAIESVQSQANTTDSTVSSLTADIATLTGTVTTQGEDLTSVQTQANTTEATVETVNDQVASLQSTVNAQASDITDVTTTANDNTASISATNSLVATLQGDTNSNAAAQISNSLAIANETGSRVTSFNSITADFETATASIQTLSEATTTSEDSTATTLDTLSTSLDGTQATVSEQATTLSELGGKAEAYLKFTAAAGSNPAYVVITSDGAVSNVSIEASTFQLLDVSSGSTIVPISYASGQWVFDSNVAIEGSLIVSGSITTSAIASGSITNTNYTESTSSVSLGSANSAAVQIGAITLTDFSGTPITLDVLVTFANTSGSYDYNIVLMLLRDGVQVGETFGTFARQNSASISGGALTSVSAPFFDVSAAAGAHSWTVTAQNVGGPGANIYAVLCRIIIQDLRTET